MNNTFRLYAFLIILSAWGCNTNNKSKYIIPAEFDKQEYIWLSWYETGFLGGEPFYTTIINAIKEIHPFVKVKIFYGPQLEYDAEQMQRRIYSELLKNNIDTSRIQLFYNELPFGAIQDPGPVFLKNSKNQLAIADFRYSHPDKRSEEIDKNVALKMNLPVISSSLISEGGAWQTNGKGTLLLVESVELDRNKDLTKEKIEDEYKRVLGVTKIIWLKKGLQQTELWPKVMAKKSLLQPTKLPKAGLKTGEQK